VLGFRFAFEPPLAEVVPKPSTCEKFIEVTILSVSLRVLRLGAGNTSRVVVCAFVRATIGVSELEKEY